MTLIGLGLLFLSVSCVFPVTSHDLVQGMMARALGQLASAAEDTIAEIIAEPGSQDSSGRPRSGEKPHADQPGSLTPAALPSQSPPETPRQPVQQSSCEPSAAGGSSPCEQPSAEQSSSLAPCTPRQQQQRSCSNGSRSGGLSSSQNDSPAADHTDQHPNQQQQGSEGSPSGVQAADSSQRLRSAFELAAAMPVGSAEGEQQAAAAEQPPAAASALLPTPAASLPPGSQPGTPPAAATQRPHVSVRRRLQLNQQPSLIAVPPDRAILAGGSRAAVGRALHQLRMPAGPELLAEAEPLLGRVYCRLVMRFSQVGLASVKVWCGACVPLWGWLR